MSSNLTTATMNREWKKEMGGSSGCILISDKSLIQKLYEDSLEPWLTRDLHEWEYDRIERWRKGLKALENRISGEPSTLTDVEFDFLLTFPDHKDDLTEEQYRAFRSVISKGLILEEAGLWDPNRNRLLYERYKPACVKQLLGNYHE